MMAWGSSSPEAAGASLDAIARPLNPQGHTMTFVLSPDPRAFDGEFTSHAGIPSGESAQRPSELIISSFTRISK